MALLLNETDLIASVCDNVPVGMIELVLRGVGRDHFERLLNFVGERIGASAHVEFYLEWFLSFCKVSQHWSGFWWCCVERSETPLCRAKRDNGKKTDEQSIFIILPLDHGS